MRASVAQRSVHVKPFILYIEISEKLGNFSPIFTDNNIGAIRSQTEHMFGIYREGDIAPDAL